MDHINAHGSSTSLNDVTETAAIKAVFGEHAYATPISGTKSLYGHPLGAAGAVEAVLSALTLQHQVLPPTVNLENPDPACDLDYVCALRPHRVRTIVSNSFGFGGINVCLVFAQAA